MASDRDKIADALARQKSDRRWILIWMWVGAVGAVVGIAGVVDAMIYHP